MFHLFFLHFHRRLKSFFCRARRSLTMPRSSSWKSVILYSCLFIWRASHYSILSIRTVLFIFFIIFQQILHAFQNTHSNTKIEKVTFFRDCLRTSNQHLKICLSQWKLRVENIEKSICRKFRINPGKPERIIYFFFLLRANRAFSFRLGSLSDSIRVPNFASMAQSDYSPFFSSFYCADCTQKENYLKIASLTFVWKNAEIF